MAENGRAVSPAVGVAAVALAAAVVALAGPPGFPAALWPAVLLLQDANVDLLIIVEFFWNYTVVLILRSNRATAYSGNHIWSTCAYLGCPKNFGTFAKSFSENPSHWTTYPVPRGLQQKPGVPFDMSQNLHLPDHPFLEPHCSQQFCSFSTTMYPSLSLNLSPRALSAPGPPGPWAFLAVVKNFKKFSKNFSNILRT